MAGHDRFVADIRPLMQPIMKERGLDLSICCHPYDLCTELIARELGVIVTDENGEPLSSPLSNETDVAWVGYANRSYQGSDRASFTELTAKTRPVEQSNVQNRRRKFT